MSATSHRRLWLLLGSAAAVLSLGACNTVSDSARGALSAITPYKVEVVQGNFVSKEQVAALKPGMSRQQVRDVLGTSLLTDVFHKNRWDYVFTIQRQGIEAQKRHLTLYFDGETLTRFEGDEMPSEAEFVAQVDNHRRTGKVPELQASEDQLKKYDPPVEQQAAGDKPQVGSATVPPLPVAYPPLETGR